MEHGRMWAAVAGRQGGGIGKALIERSKQARPDIAIITLGTNVVTTANMIKSDANNGATGENAITFNAARVYILAGPIGILMPNGLLRELTPRVAEAIGASNAAKIVIPSRQCSIRPMDGTNQSIKFYSETAAQIFEEEIRALEGL